MSRYFEWLFPILRYLRLRQEVSAWRAWGTLAGSPLVTALIVVAIEFYIMFNQGFATRNGLGFDEMLNMVLKAFAANATVAAIFFAGISFIEYWVARLFVRHQPGRRRPKCMRQTMKFIALGSQSWAILFNAVVGIYLALATSDLHGPKSDRTSLWMITAAATAILTVFIVTTGSLSVQAALAVIALQDDRRCQHCGYFLIGLTLPRCPECGTEFDPAKLAQLSVTNVPSSS